MTIPPVPPGSSSEDPPDVGGSGTDAPTSPRFSDDRMPDVAAVGDETVLPGVHRGGFQRLPTAPVGVTSATAPAEPGVRDTDTGELLPAWMPAPAPDAPRGLAGWALGFAIVGLVVSLFVGWGLLFGVVGIVMASLALRGPLESRAVAIWALVLGAVSVLYSAGWLLWAASRLSASGG